MAHLVVENLTFTYPREHVPAIKNVCLSVERGEFVVLCGASGCGKTTLVRHLKAPLAPHGTATGSVLLDGTDVRAASTRDQAARVAFVAQDPNERAVCDRVWHELAFGLENLGVEPSRMRARVAEMASYLGIGDWFHRDVAQLSGGQKQLLNLAAALVLQPEVLVLDEPTSQLDPVAAEGFLATVRRLNLELGTTVVMTEHRLEDVLCLADQAVVLENGAVLAHGEPRDVAEYLLEHHHILAGALPTPARVCHAATNGGNGAAERRRPASCPLTVREGRLWLASELERGGLPAEDPPPAPRPAPKEAGRPPARDAALSVRNVWLRYAKGGPDVLRGLSLTVDRQTVYALVGANGCGKSTLLKTLCGVCTPQRGSVEVLGRSVRRRGGDLFRGCLAMLPQNPADLFARQTVREELDEMAAGRPASARGAAGPYGASAEDAAEDVVALCGIGGLLERHPRDLSGGERQRVALAKVLLTDPRLILLDEPTKGLDALSKQGLARIVERLRGQGATVVMVSHDLAFCAQVADRVGMVFDGRIAAEGTPEEFFSDNAFYTTAARRMGRGLVPGITAEDVAAALARASASGGGPR